jgi:hypothetical protein
MPSIETPQPAESVTEFVGTHEGSSCFLLSSLGRQKLVAFSGEKEIKDTDSLPLIAVGPDRD